jgi:hypothetical protein
MTNQDAQGDEPTETPNEISNPPPRAARRRAYALDSAIGVRNELGRLYKAARTGKVTASDAAKLASVLDVLRRTIQSSDLQTRLELLESLLKRRNKP